MPVQQATPFTVALQVPPLLQVYGDWQTSQFPSVPVQPVSQLLLRLHEESTATETARRMLFMRDLKESAQRMLVSHASCS